MDYKLTKFDKKPTEGGWLVCIRNIREELIPIKATVYPTPEEADKEVERFMEIERKLAETIQIMTGYGH